MSHQERQRIAAVLGAAPEELCKLGKLSRRARRLLSAGPEGQSSHPFSLYGEEPERADAAVPRVGGDLLGYADRILDRLRRDHRRRRPQEIAREGTWLTRTWYSPGIGLVQGKVVIPDFGEPGENEGSFNVETVPYMAEVVIDTDALLDLAGDIDKRYRPEDRYVQRVLSDLFRQMDTTDTIEVAKALKLIAGPLEILNAPTGTGKSVFVRVAASWFALNKLTITLVLPTVEATLSTAWDIQEDLQHLRVLRSLPQELVCTPLMSPYGLYERALKAGARVEGSFLDQSAKSRWRIDQLAYGCALGPLTEINAPFPPGSESCRTLTPLPPKSGNHACPWMTTTCGKFEQPRRAIGASVIVTNHHNFMVGRFPLPVVLDGRKVDDVSIAEFIFRRSHAVLIDEVDQFQSTALGMCASELVLDTRRNYAVPLKELDDDKARLPIEAAKDLCPTISHARYLSEFLLAGICTNDIHLRQYEGSGPARDQQGLNTTGWHLAGGRDRRLIMLLFPDAGITNEQEVPNELFGLLNALGPAHPGADDGYTADESIELPPHLRAVRASLEKVLAPRGEDLLAQVKLELSDALRDAVKDAHLRSEAIELLLVRTWLRELDAALALLRNKTAQLRSIGLPSARKLAERLESRVAANVLPYGMLGGAIVGYRVTGLDDPDKSAELTAQCISGDPHTYTAQLGSIVSLVLAGVERPVMGLSATAYFPQAVREHVHAEVKWWMTDAAPDSIRARRHMITDAVDQPIRISGIPQAHKRRALITLGDQLYDKQIHPELARIAKTDPARAHAAVVVNSYEHCRHIALGIRGSSLYTGGLCVAVPPDKERRDKLPPLPPGIAELTPEEFETFPSRGTILVVPMARIARGLNIVIGTKSAITPVYLCTRPLALLTDPPEMYASINAAGLRALPAGPSADPVAALQVARQAAWERLGVIMRSAPGFVATRPELQEEIVAGMIVDMIQLAGRARRGGTDMTLHLVDYAFHEDSWQSDLANILRRMYEQWHPDQRKQMNAIYREALAAFLAYAGIDANG
ncbi:hypothetical protein Cs7R123_64050 [Catellatospora sp. TT07R-123]|nr:hypothetical protein Cs7R123_64050 [Catellatospora sp. TT07R-123]